MNLKLGQSQGQGQTVLHLTLLLLVIHILTQIGDSNYIFCEDILVTVLYSI